MTLRTCYLLPLTFAWPNGAHLYSRLYHSQMLPSWCSPIAISVFPVDPFPVFSPNVHRLIALWWSRRVFCFRNHRVQTLPITPRVCRCAPVSIILTARCAPMTMTFAFSACRAANLDFRSVFLPFHQCRLSNETNRLRSLTSRSCISNICFVSVRNKKSKKEVAIGTRCQAAQVENPVPPCQR